MPMPRDFATESLSHDPIHGYIPFVSRSHLPEGEVAEEPPFLPHPGGPTCVATLPLTRNLALT